MSEQDDWCAWGESWRRQPVVDVARLQRQVRRKRWRMLAMVVFETLLWLGVATQIVLLFNQPSVSPRWKVFGLGAMAVLSVQWCLNQWLRRRTWRASGHSADALARLAARRAHAGIHLAKLGLWALALMVVFALALAWPDLQPARWRHDAELRQLLVLQIALQTPVVLVGVVFSLWYIRRQRRRLGRIARLLDEQDAAE